jgi:hypothetical protein
LLGSSTVTVAALFARFVARSQPARSASNGNAQAKREMGDGFGAVRISHW